MNWIKEWNGYRLSVPIKTHQKDASYEIAISKRPEYCDRGDWLIHIFGINDLDEADGFPRYFIGDDEEVQHQMERWLARRGAYQAWIAHQHVPEKGRSV
jgi:hypothetical protein